MSIALILEPDDFSEVAITKLQETHKVILGLSNLKSRDATNVTVIISRLAFILDKHFLSRFPRLSHIVSPTTGISHIDITYTEQSGITIISLAGESTFLSTVTPTAELALWMILSLSRRFITASYPVHSRLQSTSQPWSRDSYIGSDLNQRRVGILGYGRLGKLITMMLQPFLTTIHIYDPYISPLSDPNIIHHTDLNTFCASIDILSIHCNHTSETSNLVVSSHLDLMPSNGILINTARGSIVNEFDILSHLRTNPYFKVGLDVFEYEHNPTLDTKRVYEELLEHSLQKPDQLLLSPHIGGASYNAMRRTENFIIQKYLEKRIS